jgi:PAS domain S-box-containing protein
VAPKRDHRESILIVDDTPDNLRLLVKMLTNQGYNVRPAPSGAHALASAQKEAPDLILLDVLMPEMDGYQVCHSLKAKEMTRDVPVIFLSALSELEDKMRGFEAGAVDYIIKPFFEREVILRVETHLQNRNLQQKLLNETARFKTLAEATFEAILIHSEGKIIDVNPATIRLFQCPESRLIERDIMALVEPEFHQLLVSDQPTPFEGEVIGKDDTRIPVEIRTKKLSLRDQIVNVTAMRDLSRQKQMEQEKQQLVHENTVLKMTMKDRYKFGDIIGRCPQMQMVYELISKAAASRYPVVISGESGTGKELVAQRFTLYAIRMGSLLSSLTVGL